MLSLGAGAPLPGQACCVAESRDQPVRIAGQEVLIIRDAATHTEHFIRRANFRASQPTETFGFLVPTPTRPDLAESPGAVFEQLAELSGPKAVTRYQVQWSLLLALLPVPAMRSGELESRSAAPPPTVRVVSRAQVAGYDAVVLEANDPGALTGWLGEHGFASRPEIADWSRPYIEVRWMITAFTYNPRSETDGSPMVSTAAVRMTFAAEHPVFPYRVPSDNRTGGSLLRLYYVGDERASAQHGPSEWGARTTFARKLGEPLNHALSVALPKAGKLDGPHWLTVFEDQTWPAGEDDLCFRSAETQASVSPPPNVRHRNLLVPLDALLLVGAPAFLVIRRGRTPR